MRYLITTKNDPPFYTSSFEPENHFNSEVGMIVYDTWRITYMTDGIHWEQTLIDHL